MNLKAGIKQCNIDPCVFYRVNGLGAVILVLYKYDTLEIRDKPALIDTIECIKKECVTLSMVPLKYFLG